MAFMEKKLKAVYWGRHGETISCLFLRLKGYRIIARNLRSPFGEVDIIASKKNTLCFVEVKARHTQFNALEALSISQRNRLIRAAKSFLSQNLRYGNHDIRFDLIAIAPKRWPKHIQNAWDETFT